MAAAQTLVRHPQAGPAPLDLARFTAALQRDPDGVWRGRGTPPVSYPVTGHDDCFALEDGSFWFAHRNACLLALFRRFPAPGPLFDIGAGNGFVAAALQSQLSLPVVCVEPGADGVRHARERGLPHIVQATLHDAQFHAGSLPAIGLFDVLEHVGDEAAFLREIRRCLRPDGRLYLTVPANPWLWSPADVHAGHFRRYTIAILRRALQRAGFRPRFLSRIFSPLPLPLFLCRSLPGLLGRRQPAQNQARQHHPKGQVFLEPIWCWELSRLARGRSIPCGTSCLAVAELSSCAQV